MITRAQITKKASEHQVNARTVERDYVLAHVVAAIAGTEGNSMLVFKGGTALRVCHFPDYRYSADLDFSLEGATAPQAQEVIRIASSTIGGSIDECRLTGDDPPKIEYKGPLGKTRTLKLDLADDELVMNTEKRELLPLWPDLPANKTLRVYTPLEIAGEKLRCIIQRLQCRDLYDLSRLLNECGVDPGEAARRQEEVPEDASHCLCCPMDLAGLLQGECAGSSSGRHWGLDAVGGYVATRTSSIRSSRSTQSQASRNRGLSPAGPGHPDDAGRARRPPARRTPSASPPPGPEGALPATAEEAGSGGVGSKVIQPLPGWNTSHQAWAWSSRTTNSRLTGSGSPRANQETWRLGAEGVQVLGDGAASGVASGDGAGSGAMGQRAPHLPSGSWSSPRDQSPSPSNRTPPRSGP